MKKTITKISFIAIMLCVVMLAVNCKKDETTTTPPNNTVTDIDGNVYHTVTIGTQVWMVENLKTTHYRNGTAIPNVADNATWGALATGSYCDYNNDVNSSSIYGRLYNWYAVNTGNLCPTGWHVPTDAEWATLTTYLGGASIAGGKLKATTLWNSPNTGATNEIGFTALSAGIRSYDGTYYGMGYIGFWWCSTEDNSIAYFRGMDNNSSDVGSGLNSKTYGYSVRCIKD